MSKLLDAIRLASRDCRAQNNDVASNALLDALSSAQTMIHSLQQIEKLARAENRDEAALLVAICEISHIALIGD